MSFILMWGSKLWHYDAKSNIYKGSMRRLTLIEFFFLKAFKQIRTLNFAPWKYITQRLICEGYGYNRVNTSTHYNRVNRSTRYGRLMKR